MTIIIIIIIIMHRRKLRHVKYTSIKTVLNATNILWTCSTFKNIESTSYKSIGKQFLEINFHNIFLDKYLQLLQSSKRNT